jgi:hypothetical protein
MTCQASPRDSERRDAEVRVSSRFVIASGCTTHHAARINTLTIKLQPQPDGCWCDAVVAEAILWS